MFCSVCLSITTGGTLFDFIQERNGVLLDEEVSGDPILKRPKYDILLLHPPAPCRVDHKKIHLKHILQVFVQILLAIHHIHSLNILHRDLKTQNILLNKKRTVVKIGDFGISKVLSSKITSAHTVWYVIVFIYL